MDELLDVNGNIKQKTWTNFENHKIYAIWLGKKMGYTKPEHWYNISKNDFHNNNGGGLLNCYYNNSPIKFLKKVFPNDEWLEFKLKRTPTNYWEDINNRKIYAEWLGNKLGYSKPEDWYNITILCISNNYGGGLLGHYYNNSPIQFVKEIFPEYEWLEWLFNKTRQNYWNHINNHKIYAEWLGNKLGYSKPEDWYNITQDIILSNNGHQCLSKYNNSPIQFVKAIFPEYEWLDWKFIQTSKNYWDDIENHKQYVEWLGNKLGYKQIEDWYNITYNIIEEYHGSGLMNKYNQSPIQLLNSIFPHYEWLGWKFGMASLGIWKDINNHKKYAEWLGKILEYVEPEHWYKITGKIIKDNYGGGLIANYYNTSPILFVNTVVKTIYPDYQWIEWKFIQTSKNYWDDIENHKKYAEWLGNELGYTEREHWYKITRISIINNCGSSLLANYYNNSTIQFVKGVFPEYEWVENKFCKNKTEQKLYDILLPIYPTLITQFKEEWCKKIKCLPFDFCIPEHNIIIELDGIQHFQQVSNWSSPEEQFDNDIYKEKCANDNNYSVIRLLQEDVLYDSYDWLKDLCNAIEEIKNGDEIVNIYLCKNGEYHAF